MKTQFDYAREGILTDEMKIALNIEEIDEIIFTEKLANGRIVVPANKNRKRQKYYAIGEGCLVKINVNIGVSSECGDFKEEIEKYVFKNAFTISGASAQSAAGCNALD